MYAEVIYEDSILTLTSDSHRSHKKDEPEEEVRARVKQHLP